MLLQMQRSFPIARRRGGVRGATFGMLAVATSSALLLAVGSRVLTPDRFAALALAWTWATVYGFGIATPTEQVTNRRLNSGVRGSMRSAALWLVLSACLATALAGVASTRLLLATDSEVFLAASIPAIAGWSLASAGRGRLLGAGDFRWYTWVLVGEATGRFLLVGSAILIPFYSTTLLAAAVGWPILVAGILGCLVRIDAAQRAYRSDRGSRAETVMFVAVALGFQMVLNSQPLFLGWRADEASSPLVGAFTVANSFFRAPTVLIGAITVHALTVLSLLRGQSETIAYYARVWVIMRRTLAVAVGGAMITGALAPFVLPALYGHEMNLKASTFVALSLSTLIASVASVVVTALLAAGRAAQGAISWALGAGAAVTAAVAIPVETGLLSWGLLCGPVAVLTGSIVLFLRMKSGDRPHTED